MIYSFFKTYSSAKLHHLYWENRRLIYVSDTKKKTKKNLAHIHYTRLTTLWINDNSYLRHNLHSSCSTYAVRFVLIRWSLPAILDCCAFALLRLCYVLGNLLPFSMAHKCSVTSSSGGVSKKRKYITMEVKIGIVKRSNKQEEPPTNIGRLLGISRATLT